MTALSTAQVASLYRTLSASRMKTFDDAVMHSTCSALDLYAWNANVSASLLAPLHICEVSLRNAIAEAIEYKYGPNWPWDASFQRSLPDPGGRGVYSPRRDIANVASRYQSTGKIIPELKFVFWETMLTARHDGRLWNSLLKMIFPNLPIFPALSPRKSVKLGRLHLHARIENIRSLRNRIAHHEPIFTRNLMADMHAITAITRARCETTCDWMLQTEQATATILQRPI